MSNFVIQYEICVSTLKSWINASNDNTCTLFSYKNLDRFVRNFAIFTFNFSIPNQPVHFRIHQILTFLETYTFFNVDILMYFLTKYPFLLINTGVSIVKRPTTIKFGVDSNIIQIKHANRGHINNN